MRPSGYGTFQMIVAAPHPLEFDLQSDNLRHPSSSRRALASLEIHCVETFGEPAVNWRKKVVWGLQLTLASPKSSEAGRRAQLPNPRVLAPCHFDCAEKAELSVAMFPLREMYLPHQSVQLGLAPALARAIGKL